MKKGLFTNNDRAPAKLNITSLMDALTIILIFLLVNYSDQPEERDLPDFVSLPKVSGKIDTDNSKQLFISVGVKKIAIGKEFNVEYNNIESDIKMITQKLDNFLKNRKTSPLKAQVKDSAKQVDEKSKQAIQKIALHADKAIRYETLAEIIATLSDNGFSNIDFINLAKKD